VLFCGEGEFLRFFLTKRLSNVRKESPFFSVYFEFLGFPDPQQISLCPPTDHRYYLMVGYHPPANLDVFGWMDDWMDGWMDGVWIGKHSWEIG
jgi:hypothetical protein